MARVANAVLASGSGHAQTGQVMDLIYGGQQGYMPRIGQVGTDGKSYDEWISNSAYIKKNVIAVVIDYPKFMDSMPDSQKWIDTYKALIEEHATIDGLSSGITVETDEHAIGGGGEFQEEPTDVKRARSSISYGFKEKANKSIQMFIDYCIRYGIMDPDTKKPLVMKYITDISTIGGMYTPDYYSGTVLYIEPDTTHKVVVDAWLSTNQFFKSNGERSGRRDLKTAGETLDLSIEVSSITLNNANVKAFAQKILATLTVLDKIPDTDLILPVAEINSNVTASAAGYNRK